jgi:hypothetical protein
MAAEAVWNEDQFGCLTRDSVRVVSFARTAMTQGLPVPMVSEKADTSAPVEMNFALDVDNAGARAFEAWWTYDLHDGALPFLIYIPWGTEQPRVRARIMGEWQASRLDSFRWKISATMQIDRDTLPRFSGGAHA